MSRIRKALVAAVLAALGALGTAVLNGAPLDAQAVLSALAAGVLAGLATWGVPNTQPVSAAQRRLVDR